MMGRYDCGISNTTGSQCYWCVRLSGKDSFTIIDQLFPSKNLTDQPSHSLHVGFIRDDEKILDEVVVSIYKNPKILYR